MFRVPDTANCTPQEQYSVLQREIEHVLHGEHNYVANLGNVAAMMYHTLADCSWIGFYVFDGQELVLGPFQGRPACIRIALGRGVCGTAARELRTLNVPDVSAFDGHIACDASTRAELVIPMVLDGRLLGVLDLDSATPSRFGDVDIHACEAIVQTVITACAWPEV